MFELERFEKKGKEESENEFVLEGIAAIRRHLSLQSEAKRITANLKINDGPLVISDRSETLYWFGNDLAVISQDWPTFLEIANRRGKAVVVAYSDPSIEDDLLGRFRHIAQVGKVKFELRQLSAEQAEKLSMSKGAIWITSNDNIVRSCFVGTSPSKVLHSFFGNE